jgi:hypothetical protein
MKDRRFALGLLITVAWLSFTIYMLSVHKHPSDLDAWGNFFAGFFSPIAFLWLVLGYLQQGEELKQSTEALRLQADELKNSVEQQSQLVEVSREQAKREHEAIQEERELRRDAARPKFVPQQGGSTVSGGIITYHLSLVNVGNTATRVRVSLDPSLRNTGGYGFPLIGRDQTVAVDITFPSAATSTASITYIDADGLPGEVRFEVVISAGSQISLGEPKRVL